MKCKIDRDAAVRLYVDQHLTCAEIGRLYGASRVAVWKILQWAGVKASEGERVQAVCEQCGESFSLTRKRWRSTRKHYCSEQCYWASLANPAYNSSRQGQRMARHVAAKFVRLDPGYVVHHWDSDTQHNHPRNLAVFASHSDHMTVERGGQARPVWDGRKLTPAQLEERGYTCEESRHQEPGSQQSPRRASSLPN